MLEYITIDNVFLILGGFCILLLMISWHRDENKKFDFISLVTKEGELSLSKTGQLVALFISTWIIIHQTELGLLTEWLMTSYLVSWAGANLADKWVSGRNSSYSLTNYSNNSGEAEVDYRDFRSSQIEKSNNK